MRVAIVTESFLPRVNGVTRTVTALADHLRSRGHEALLVAAGDGPFEYAGYPVVRVIGPTGLLYPDLTIAPWAPGLAGLLRRFDPDVVHLASPAALGLRAARVARRLQVPVAAHYQTDLVAYARHYGGAALAGAIASLERRFHNRCTATYAPTETVARELTRRGIERVSVSGRGVDLVRFRPRRPGASTAARLWPEGDGPRVLCVARLAREKSLDALVRLARRHPSIRVLLVGDGPCRVELEAAAPENLRLAGSLEGDALADVYAAAELFAYPSQTETFGQVVQEAMASGLPVVGMRAGGVADVVDDGRTGILVDPAGADFEAVVAALAADPARRRSLGAAARRAVATRSWESVLDALLADYARLAGSGSAEPLRLPRRRAAGQARRAAAFFDVDRTLLRGSCFLALARPMWRAGVVSRRVMLRAAAHQLWFSARGASARRLVSGAAAGARAIAGADAEALRRVGRRSLPVHVLPRVHPGARRAIEAHRRAGDLVFLVSSAPQEIVSELAATLGADGYAATSAEVRDGRYTGRLLSFCHGAEKAAAMLRLARRHGVDLGRSVAYADSGSDLPMLEAVGRAVCVNPDRRLRAEARRRGWECARFDLAAAAPADVCTSVAAAA